MAMMLSGMLMLRHLDESDGRRPARARDRRGDRRGQERHLRHEADPRRPDRRRHERGRGRDHREAGGSAVRRKVTVVGAGNVGATCAQELARRDYADVVLVDIKEGLPQGKALDINQAARRARLRGERHRLERLRGDGRLGGRRDHGRPAAPAGDEPRRPRARRTRRSSARSPSRSSPRAPTRSSIVVSNPLDAMCHVAKNVSGWPKERVFGMAGHPRHRPLLDLHRLGDRRCRSRT